MGTKVKVWEIVQLFTDEGSFTPRGANKGAKQMFFKEDAKDGEGAAAAPRFPRMAAWLKGIFKDDSLDPRSTADVMADRELWDRYYELRGAMEQSICEIQDSDVMDKGARVILAVQQFAELMGTALGGIEKMAPLLKAFDERVTQFGAQAVEKQAWDLGEFFQLLDLLEKEAKAPGRPSVPAEGDDPMKVTERMSKWWNSLSKERQAAAFGADMPADVQAEMVKSLQEGAAGTPVAKDAPAVPSKVECPGCKQCFEPAKHAAQAEIQLENLSPALRARLEKADANDARLMRMEKERVEKECEETAKSLKLPLEASKTLLVKAALGQAATKDEVLACFSGLSAMAKDAEKTLFHEKGHTGAAGGNEKTAEGKLQSIAKEKRGKDGKLTEEQALDEAMAENPDLAQAFYEEDKATKR